jgi:hypothetical protein
MDTDSTIIACAEAAELILPRQSSFRDPAGFSQPTAVRLAALGQQGPDAPKPQLAAVRLGIVGAVALHAVRPSARSARLASNRTDAIHQRQQLGHVVAVGRRDLASERNALRVGNQVVLAAQLAAVRGIRAGVRPPPTARTELLSITARDQSMAPAHCNPDSNSKCKRSQTPRFWNSFNRRQQVMPEQPISWGRYSQGMPVLRTNKMPVSATRCGTGGRPPLVERFCGGNNGSIKAHKSSGNSGLAMFGPP